MQGWYRHELFDMDIIININFNGCLIILEYITTYMDADVYQRIPTNYVNKNRCCKRYRYL